MAEVTEEQVTRELVQHLQGEYHEVEHGEISLGAGSSSWSADIVCKSERKAIQLAVECKSGNSIDIRKGISQALSYKLVYSRRAALAAPFDERNIAMVKRLPIRAYNYSPDGCITVISSENECIDEIKTETEELTELRQTVRELEDENEELKRQLNDVWRASSSADGMISRLVMSCIDFETLQ